MRRLTAATLGATLLGATLASSPMTAPAGAAGAPRCAGEPATVVGTPGAKGILKGTPGRDVIVTNGQLRTNADRGRDLICVTGGGRQWIKAGDGNDRVLVPKGRRVGVKILPGNGNDVVRGGAGNDLIEQRGAHGRDTLRLGPGDDAVYYLREDRVAYRSADRVTLGAGDDEVTQLVGTPMPIGASFRGGPGHDEVLLAEPMETPAASSRFDIDMAAGTVRADDGVVRVPGVESLRLVASRAAHVEYVGSEGDDTFSSYPSPVSADMGPGNDELVLQGTDHEGSHYEGGTGTDLLAIGAGADAVTADLVAGTATVVDGQVTELYAFGAFEGLRAQVWDAVRITGNDDANLLVVDGCDVEVSAGGGDDVVRWREVLDVTDVECPVGSPGARLNGDAGDDRLTSGELDDVLVGGPGTDVADGGGGEDHCEAETRIDCES